MGLSEEALRRHGIVPDVIHRPPCTVLEVKYADSVNVEMGNSLLPSQVASAPSVSWLAEPGALYTLLLLSKRGSTALDLRWAVANIPGSDLTGGSTLVKYRKPTASGLHCYVFLLYKQAGLRAFDVEAVAGESQEDSPFKVDDFAKKHCLGEPVAGNFFQTG